VVANAEMEKTAVKVTFGERTYKRRQRRKTYEQRKKEKSRGVDVEMGGGRGTNSCRKGDHKTTQTPDQWTGGGRVLCNGFCQASLGDKNGDPGGSCDGPYQDHDKVAIGGQGGLVSLRQGQGGRQEIAQVGKKADRQ